MQQSRDAEVRYLSPTLTAEVLRLLKAKFGHDVKIRSCPIFSEVERRNVLARIHLDCDRADVPKSVIFKQSLPKKTDNDYQQVNERFSRDWAGLEFANQIAPDSHNVPKFFGSNKEHRFILIEDLGQDHVSLVNSLLIPGNEAGAMAALERYMRALGSFHATSYEHTGEYLKLLCDVNSAAKLPPAELQADSALFTRELATSTKLLNVTITPACLDEMTQVMAAMFNPGPFTVLIHGDIAPDNVFDHEARGDLQLIDFENASVRNALMDGTYLRMCIPTGWCAKALPEDVLQHLEKIYRSELAKRIDAAKDDNQYHTAYTQACCFWAMVEMAFMNNRFEVDIAWGGSKSIKPPMEWDANNNSGRARFLSRLQAFLDVNKEHNLFPNIAKLAEDMLLQIQYQNVWPNAAPLGVYPAFSQRPSLENELTSSSIGLRK